jgi:hypothetical protein
MYTEHTVYIAVYTVYTAAVYTVYTEYISLT